MMNCECACEHDHDHDNVGVVCSGRVEVFAMYQLTYVMEWNEETDQMDEVEGGGRTVTWTRALCRACLNAQPLGGADNVGQVDLG
jgi:hypothetical protein